MNGRTYGNLQVIWGGGYKQTYYTVYQREPFKVLLRTTQREKVSELLNEVKKCK